MPEKHVYQVIMKGNKSFIPLVLVRKLALYTEGKERPEKEADHSRLTGLIRRKLTQDGHKMSRSPHPPTRLGVHVEWPNRVQSHTLCKCLNNRGLFQKAESLKIMPTMRTVGSRYIPRVRGMVG